MMHDSWSSWSKWKLTALESQLDSRCRVSAVRQTELCRYRSAQYLASNIGAMVARWQRTHQKHWGAGKPLWELVKRVWLSETLRLLQCWLRFSTMLPLPMAAMQIEGRPLKASRVNLLSLASRRWHVCLTSSSSWPVCAPAQGQTPILPHCLSLCCQSRRESQQKCSVCGQQKAGRVHCSTFHL